MQVTDPEKDASSIVGGRFVENIIYFCRTLRRAGVPVAPSQIQDLIRAIEIVGFSQKIEFYETLRACLITRREHMELFDQIFTLYWRDPDFIKKIMQTLMPIAQNMESPKPPKPAAKRAAEAMTRDASVPDLDKGEPKEELILDAKLSVSKAERLASMDFEQMSSREVKDAQKALLKLDFQIPPSSSRRYIANSTGSRTDARATFHQARSNGGELLKLIKKKRSDKKRNVVALCDISGSMSAYSSMMMHFIYALRKYSKLNSKLQLADIHAFTFGTRLTNISPLLRESDPDAFLDSVGALVQDWDGGTRIGTNLEEFNIKWSRRVLSSDTIVLLMTDGLERDDVALLDAQMKRLNLSSGHLIWLNPLLRFDEFKPLAKGIKTMVPHVDRIVSCHNLNSLSELSDAIGQKY